jgi:hypothetical protein
VRLVLLTIAITAAFCATANAGWRIDRAQQVAAIVWHHPCDDHVTVQVGPVVGDDVHALAYIDECRIVLNLPASFGATAWSWNSTCYTMLHEYGHLAGYRDPANTADPMHSNNPDSVMYTEPAATVHYFGQQQYDARCDQRGRPFLAEHR